MIFDADKLSQMIFDSDKLSQTILITESRCIFSSQICFDAHKLSQTVFDANKMSQTIFDADRLSKMIFDIQRSDFSKEKELLKKRIRQKRRLLTLKE